MPRYFTIEEANALIPQLELIMSKLQRHGALLRDELAELASTMAQAPEALTTSQILELRPQLRPVVEQMDALLREIEDHGLEMKGLDLGLVDFPAELNGKAVLLCWQYGEKEVAFYHSPEAGFAGRKPLRSRGARPTYLQ